MFYKYQDDTLLFGRVVTAPTFELTIETKNDFEYPVDNWYWFDSIDEANVFFNIISSL
jgi:hypothetical protein